MLDSTNEAQGSKCRCKNGLVYTPWITVRGKRIPHPKGGVYRFPCRYCNGQGTTE